VILPGLSLEPHMVPAASLRERLDEAGIGEAIFALAAEIYPICRSITGDGVRSTLAHLGRHIDLEVHEVPTGTQVFDWTIPREWTIRDAYIKNAAGERVVDFGSCNLHVLNYSRPIRATLPLDELKKHIFTLPDQPDLIPYRTSYYADAWGFCMAHDQLAALPDGLYEVMIDASLEEVA
jgi:aminopeptidase-like protein